MCYIVLTGHYMIFMGEYNSYRIIDIYTLKNFIFYDYLGIQCSTKPVYSVLKIITYYFVEVRYSWQFCTVGKIFFKCTEIVFSMDFMIIIQY